MRDEDRNQALHLVSGVDPRLGAPAAELSFILLPRPHRSLGLWKAGLALFFWPGNRGFREQQSTTIVVSGGGSNLRPWNLKATRVV